MTYRGAAAEGLLLNVRMVNATFEDRNRTDFNAEANADEFIAQIPDYVAPAARVRLEQCLAHSSNSSEFSNRNLLEYSLHTLCYRLR